MSGLTALIPLDGTKLSESAIDMLPFATKLGISKVRLVSAWESGWGDETSLPGGKSGEIAEVAEKGRAYLDAYLNDQADRVRALGLEAETVVKVGRAAEAVLDAAGEDTDLIIIATHGRTGIARFRLGSVADKIIRNAVSPVLVVGPNVSIELASFTPKVVVAPLDGSPLSEESLPLATWITDLTGADLDLVRVVTMPTMAMDPTLGTYTPDLLTAIEDAAEAYLQEKATQYGGTRRVKTTLRLGSPAEQIKEHLEANQAELVVLGSHGRSGVVRATLGSVADRVLHGPAPVLVFGPGDAPQSKLFALARAAAK